MFFVKEKRNLQTTQPQTQRESNDTITKNWTKHNKGITKEYDVQIMMWSTEQNNNKTRFMSLVYLSGGIS